MKLRNKKTGEIIEVNSISFTADIDTRYYSLAELNEEWGDYRPAEKKPKRYQLVKDLPTFKAGEIFELWDSIETQGLYRESDGVMAYHQKTLDKFPNILEEWFEEIKPAEPLIKDKNTRKAVRAWAEVNSIEGVIYDERLSKSSCTLIDAGNGFYDIELVGWIPTLNDGGTYTIAELCGEEEE